MTNQDYELKGCEIEKWRVGRNLSQQQLANQLGVGIATVSRWENDRAQPTGIAEVVLKAAIRGAVVKGAAMAAAGVAAFSIYSILKEIYDE